MSIKGVILMVALPMVALCQMKDMAVIAKASLLGVAASFLTLIGILVGACSYDDKFFQPKTMGNVMGFQDDAGFQQFLGAGLKIIFSFGAVLVTAGCRRDIANDEDMKPAINWAHILCAAIYATLCVVSVFCWGEKLVSLKGEMVTHLMRNSEGQYTWAAVVCQASVFLNLAVSLPLILGVFLTWQDGMVGKFAEEGSAKNTMFSRVGRVITVCLCVLLAFLLYSSIETIVDIVAGVCLAPLTILLPIACYWGAQSQDCGGFAKARSAHQKRFIIHVVIAIIGTSLTLFLVKAEVIDRIIG
jgi:uncharacterized membrane protein YwzB